MAALVAAGVWSCGRQGPAPGGTAAATPAPTAPQSAEMESLPPALTFGRIPPSPLAPPALAPHTARHLGAARIVDAEPTAGSWLPVLYTPADDAAPPPPTGDGLEADRRQAAEYQTGDPARWSRTAAWWSAGAVLRWNEIARTLTARRSINSSHSSRLFALLTVAQYDAAVAARRFAARYAHESADAGRLAAQGFGRVEKYGYPSQEAAVAQASVGVLSAFFPSDRRFLQQNALAHLQSRIWIGANRPSAIEAGLALGRGAALAALDRAAHDGADKAGGPQVERQAGRWYSASQTLPGWRGVRPWVMQRADQFRAPPPPDLASPEGKAAVAEIRAFSDDLSAEQLSIAEYWDLGVGGISVAGMWNMIALDYAEEAGLSEARTARALALLNMAIMDAGIACWETKYHYLVPRPEMADPDLQSVLRLPAHPSYTSGHSAFSGAAETILADLFPAKKEALHHMAEEASASRWYGGIHYRFDGDEGLRQGREVAALVLHERAAKDGCPRNPP